MKAHLMYRDADFAMKKDQKDRPWEAGLLARDLEFETLFAAMAQGDEFLLQVARAAMAAPLDSPDAIRYRQDILKDCLANTDALRQLYDLSVEAIVIEKKSYFGFYTRYPAALLSSARELMEAFIAVLKKLRDIADRYAGDFKSPGFVTFFAMIHRELTDDYFDTLAWHLKALKFRNGVLVSARIGAGNKGEDYVLRKPLDKDPNLLRRVFGKKPPTLTFRIPERDEAGSRALSELEARGIDLVANAVAQSAEHVLSFFNMLRTEIGFYIGCVNLGAALEAKGYALCCPLPCGLGECRLEAEGLYDACLALRSPGRVVPNDLHADGCDLVIITGANEGGKSTFLRSVGIAQVMMQAGMMAPAVAFTAGTASAAFTHYKREEDVTMTSGKFDEELVRINEIVDHMREHAVVFFNESFASTNEREGAEVAADIVRALLDKHVRVFFVTHMYAFSHRLFEHRQQRSLFLRAERMEGGQRTFHLVAGEPLETSYGEDLYRRVFIEHEPAPESGIAAPVT